MGAQLLTFGAAFLGSAVESVEALTIVLAVGLTRGWRAPLYGTVAALVSLAVLVVLFGLRWLHKAVLRSAGVVAMHDEEHAYRQTVSQLAGATERHDWVGFVIALKGVFLEGIEVVFIVVAVGGTSKYFPEAVAGGILAMLVVAAIGVVVRKPLA